MMMTMNQSQSQHASGGGYGMWPPVTQLNQLKFNNQNTKRSGYASVPFSSQPRNNRNWKVKKAIDKRNNNSNRKEFPVSLNSGSNLTNVGGAGGNDRLKARRYLRKKRFNFGVKSAPFAPRNTTSFLIRAKKSGGITSLISPCPVTPAVLPTPSFSPSREDLVDMAKEEWGVDGYGSMKGLIRLRSPGNDEECGSSGSDVEEHVEVERRLDHDLSRFEMVYPNYGVADHTSYLLENKVDDQDTHITRLEEENLILKERLFLMEREFGNLRTRLQSLEMQREGDQGLMEEVLDENESVDENKKLLEDENDELSRGKEIANGVIEGNKIEDHVNGTVASYVNR